MGRAEGMEKLSDVARGDGLSRALRSLRAASARRDVRPRRGAYRATHAPPIPGDGAPRSGMLLQTP